MSAFGDWIDVLTEDVVQEKYGYEPGEFTVYPEHWRPMFDKGLTPSQAFKRACEAHDEARKAEDAERAANWARIQAADAALRPGVKATSEGVGDSAQQRERT